MTRPRPLAFLSLPVLALGLACGGGSGKTTTDGGVSSGVESSGGGSSGPATTTVTGGAASTSGGSEGNTGSSGEASTGPGGSSTTTGMTSMTGTSTTAGTSGTTGTTTGEGTGSTGGTTGGGSTGSTGGEACQGQGMSCAGVGALCCQGLECCAGVPVPEGKEFCSNNCPISDRNLKTDFAEIDPAQVLSRVVELPITTWRYRKDGAEVRHLGPMAQDFHAAFGLWDTDKMIFPLDASGVSFAAIQALNARLVAAEADNEALRARLERLERALEQRGDRR
jgi:hypothetical protein